MPFLRGVAPIRRTFKYLEASPIQFKDYVKVMIINYNEPKLPFTSKTSYPHHEGAKEFVFWTVPQIQYKNKNLQIASFKNMTPSPFITCYLEDGKKVLFDVDGHTKEEIIERLHTTLGKDEETLEQEAIQAEKKDNPANMGMGCSRFCICNVPGQVPCPGFIPLPKTWRGKYAIQGFEEEEAEN